MPEERLRRFEELMLPHLDAAHNLAFWLTRDHHDACDVVQEACARALRFFDGFRGENAKFWLLAIVRRCAYTWLERKKPSAMNVSFEDEREITGEAAVVRGPVL
jgi:DNA-directed RNA polymerase specialized sigma24 family protein